MRRAALAPLVLLALAASGCGQAPEPPARTWPSSGPSWSLGRGEPPLDGVAVDLHADAPCRAQLLVFETGREPSAVSERTLAVGELVRLWWKGSAAEAPSAGRPISLADQQAGRTEGWIVSLDYGWQDDGVRRRAVVVATRPGRGRALPPYDALPPVSASPLPYGTEVDLCTLAIVDGGSGDLALVAGLKGARLKGTLDPAAGDQARLARLVLRIDRVGP